MICTVASNGLEFANGCLNDREEPHASIRAALRNNIWKLYGKGYDVFYSNTEIGVPLWAGSVVTAFGFYNPIYLRVAIPFEEQTSKWPEEQRDMYFMVHEKSVEANLIHTRYTSDCYKDADKYMIDNSDALFYYGKEDDDCFILNYAKEKGLKIFYFYEDCLILNL